MRKRRKKKDPELPISWLPVDSRLFTPLFSFGHIHGMAKMFLVIEMGFAIACVVGTMLLLILQLAS